MAAFHELHPATGAADPVPTTAAPSPARALRQRRRWYEDLRWYGAAAAVVVLAALGFVVARGGGSDDQVADDLATDEQSAAVSVAAAEDVDSSSRLTEEAELAPSDEATLATTDAAEAPSGAIAESAAEDVATEAVDEPASSADDAMLAPLPDPAVHFDDGVPIASPVQLRSAAQYLLDQQDLGELGPTPEYSCPYYHVLGIADFDDAGRLREVLIDVDERADLVTAVDRVTCDEIAEITLTEP